MDKSTADELLDFVDLTKPVRLILGYRSNDDKVSLRRVALAQDAQDMFAEIASEVLENRKQRDPEEWEPARPVSKETYLVTTCEAVGEVPQVSKSKVQPLLAALIDTQNIAEMEGKTLLKTDPYFYAFQFGIGSDSVTFLRKLNPLRGLRKKRLGFLDDELSLAHHAVFAFDSCVDLIITEEHLFVFNQTAFAAIFRGQEELKKMAKGWIDGIKDSTPMTQESYEILLAKGVRDSRVAKRIESIARRGHLDSLDTSDLREGMEECDLNPSVYMNQSNELVLTADTLFDILKFLNEDMFRGVLTDDPYEVDSKARRD
ncbi:Kiwa anti-phage protein KwaB-like domain-containing protein [Corynebacterium sp. ACRPQ]|uniref:Kiwa anti-phage protein KwaB-like domain-containing protein n=1 Tax=Corynebacterium sp. ACRPQ TaxID=2918201 RepID=UPI001EF31628|nr:Kiwa anti-phage protein KwaB-like domain-containing protein [Corynebacterium sp. ACRPQ]MCG7441419.1 DUF4868 domain-containing protein [Corynebacterium sp. ACRPQ]